MITIRCGTARGAAEGVGARLCGATVVGTGRGRGEGTGGRAELTARGGLVAVEVDEGALTAGAAEVVGREEGTANWAGAGAMARLPAPVDVARYSDPSITATAAREMLRAEAR
jgi:hypothetical protein